MSGGCNVLTASRPRTDYAEVWRLITEHKVQVLTIIGDAVARPLIDEYQAHPDRYDASSLISIGSGGAPLSTAGPRGAGCDVSEHDPQRRLRRIGDRRAGAQLRWRQVRQLRRRDARARPGDARRDRGRARSGEGRVARRGHIPIGYYNDPEKTAATFVEHGGERWVLTGDVATVLDDGAIQLLGRGSMCINTGARRSSPKRSRACCSAIQRCTTPIVVGVPDPALGRAGHRGGADHPRSHDVDDDCVDRALPRATRGVQAAPNHRRRGCRATITGRQGGLRMGQRDRRQGDNVSEQSERTADVRAPASHADGVRGRSPHGGMTLQVVARTRADGNAFVEARSRPCYHMIEVFEHPEHVDVWRRAAEGETVDWSVFPDGYVASVDWPGGCVLAGDGRRQSRTRSSCCRRVPAPEAWWKSANDTIFQAIDGMRQAQLPQWTAMVEAIFANRFTARHP